jgi:hypothetical protein
MITSWIVSSGVIARTLPRMMVWMFTEVGDSDTMKRPSAKNDEKMSPMIASSRSFVRWLRKSIAPAAAPPDRNAPIEKGRPSMYAPATPGTIECESASPISDQPLSIR